MLRYSKLNFSGYPAYYLTVVVLKVGAKLAKPPQGADKPYFSVQEL